MTNTVKASAKVHEHHQGPIISEVAANMLREALKERFSTQDLDPDQTLIGTPQWQLVDGEPSAGPVQYQTLTQAVVRQFFTTTVANYLEGEHFLTRLPLTSPVVHLNINIEDIAHLLNDYAPLLFVAFGEQQLAFWNEEVHNVRRWHGLSNSLRMMLDVQQVNGWNSDQCRVARAVSLYPDKTVRQLNEPAMKDIQVCLIDIDITGTTGNEHLMVGGAAVINGRFEQRDLLMMYTVEDGYESFDTLEKLGAVLPERIGDKLAGRDMQWRLFEPDGDFFDHMAWALINTQIDTLSTITGENPSEKNARGSLPEEPTRSQLDQAIPDWLTNASTTDLDIYSQSLRNLGKLLRHADSGLYRIPSVTDFAQQKMREAITADKPVESVDLPLDQLEITIINSFEAGGLTLPNPLDTHTETLGEFALQNEAPYRANLRFKNARQIPDWLTPEYLTTMAAQVNVGEVYPKLIKSRLIDDKSQAALQQKAYTQQLPVHLLLMALEHKIRRLGGVDEQGFHTIRQWLEPEPGEPHPVVIRPLVLMHGTESAGDTVANMFIIGPRSPDSGPCLLYRPLLDTPLLQFPSEPNLIYAMHQPGELRDSILAWLPDSALSFKYAQYAFPVGFPSPWLALQVLTEPWSPATWENPLKLSTVELAGDAFSFLFKSNAMAMATLADRQSQSNAERQWALLRDSGWALFNVASNFLSGPAGIAVWVWQALSDIQQAEDAGTRGDRLSQWSAMGDLLLMLGLVVAHRAMSKRKTDTGLAETPRDIDALEPMPQPATVPAPTVKLIDTPIKGRLPVSHFSSLEIGGSVPRRSPGALGVYLDSIKVPAPDLASEEVTILKLGNAPLYHLESDVFAQVGERWFKVAEDADGNLKIAYPDDPTRTGPLLIHNRQGSWFLDLRLRLRGGAGGESLKSRLKAQRQEKANKKKELEGLLNEFQKLEVAKERAFDIAQAKQESNPGETGPYLVLLDQQISDYQLNLERLEQWRAMDGSSSSYVYDMLRMTTQLQKYIALWFLPTKASYMALTDTLLQPATPRAVYIDAARKAIQASGEMIARFQLSQVTRDRLVGLGGLGIREVEQFKKVLPSFTEWDLKANEIGMSHELCMKPGNDVDMAAPREAVAKIMVEAGKAGHNMAKLMKVQTPDQPLAVRLGALSTLVDTFADADQRLKEIPGEYPDQVDPIELERVRHLVVEFRELAQHQLSTLSPEGPAAYLPSAPKPAVAGPSRLPGKVTKNRPRPSANPSNARPEEQPLKEIIPARLAPAVPPARNDTETVGAGLELNLDVDNFIERTKKDALKPQRIPADMQDLFDLQANRLEQMAANIEQNIDLDRFPVATLPEELRGNAVRLRSEGIKTRTLMLKQRKPRQAYLQWLLTNKQVRIVKNQQGRIKTRQRKDYFEEFRILDIANQDQPLWLAHFHYDALTATPEQFTAAHLKIADEHLVQLPTERRKELTELVPIDYVLREITDTTPFLNPKPDGGVQA
ncbi:dermonecrotic toxin domain-containing protein [Pseudomonas vancouverensis]|uniref:Dermonecrotic toxin N-terminal domain-containing protein n=1 Tax=Pseudomonas vancouverensis TaxID=95300 RepID=A0A1H2PE15_PSEVA|nr:DUF6543 domain-containing protein [Pseudomonas vancouverensis]KAB0497832.1 hypothetical protein F7R09_09980 [Pseudomonas vancouverensis]TDB66559.1 hypothetical protein EIY72_06750 [Pseudomonas vancouverensis]SDV15902.1 hypothetical protein SAMN05216558_5193 [Pseudomonas vancouverensis]